MSFLNPNLDLKPGNYAVIFSSERPVNPSPEGYDAMDDATMRAVEQLDGYLGYEVVRQGTDAIFVSYWRDAAAVDAWRAQAQRTVDDAEMKYVVVHIHKLLTPED